MPKFLSAKVLVWLILAFIWSTTWIFIKIGLGDLPPIAFSSARFLLSAAILFVIVKVQSLELPKTSKEWRLIAFTGVLQFSINYSCVFWSEQYITSGLAAVLQATIPVFGLAIGWMFLPDEHVTTQKVIAIILGIVGVAVIFIDQLEIENTLAFVGCVVVVVGAYAAAQSSVLTKAKGSNIHPAVFVFCQMLCGLPLIIAYSLITEGNPLTYHWSWSAIGCIIYLAVFGSVIAFWLYYWLLHRVESTKAMMISLVTPLLAVIIGAVTVGESLPPQTYLGGVMIVGSIALIVFRRKNLEPQMNADQSG
jgi:drug/metabolite transporter (DMT)-like permease